MFWVAAGNKKTRNSLVAMRNPTAGGLFSSRAAGGYAV